MKFHIERDWTDVQNGKATDNPDSSNKLPYLIGGVVIGIIILIILIVLFVIAVNKLRKREETTVSPSANTTTIEVHQENAITTQHGIDQSNMEQQSQPNGESNNNSKAIVKNKSGQQVTFVRTQGTGTNDHVNVIDNSEWTFPPKAPTPHIYHCINPELLVASDKSSFKGFRKQFSGRFKRLVARKPEPAPVIPPELKPQLKTIYVY